MAKTPKKPSPRGRPKKHDDDRKDDVLRVRLTPAQREGINAAAARGGLDASTWVRLLALRAAGMLPER
jgi:hypothetical protein